MCRGFGGFEPVDNITFNIITALLVWISGERMQGETVAAGGPHAHVG
jgi:hypothetical protein